MADIQYVIDVDGPEVSLTGTTKGDETERAALRHTAWKWSQSMGCYVLPRNLRPETRDRAISWFTHQMREAGREVQVNRTSHEETALERREASAERLDARADRHEARAGRLAREAEASRVHWDEVTSQIPAGQPILVGHHSEKRHRRLLERWDRASRRYLDQEAEARSRAEHAEGIRRRLARGATVPALLTRLDLKMPELRRVLRDMEGATGEYRERCQRSADLLASEIELDQATLAELEARGHKVWGPADFTRGDEVACSAGWVPVVRVNRETLTVRVVSGGWDHTERLPYRDVRGRREAPGRSGS